MPDAGSALADVGCHFDQPADGTFVDQIVRLAEVILIRPLLAAGLKYRAIAPGGGNHGSALLDGERQWLFAINVFAGLHGGDGDQRVPMVGRRNHHGADVLSIEQVAKIFVQRRSGRGAGQNVLRGHFAMELIDVAGGSDLNARIRQEHLAKMLTAAEVSGPDQPDDDPIAGRRRGRLSRAAVDAFTAVSAMGAVSSVAAPLATRRANMPAIDFFV